MMWLRLLSCVGLIIGGFLLLGLSPMAFTNGVMAGVNGKPTALANEVRELTGRKKPSYLRRELAQVESILHLTGRSGQFPLLCLLSLLCFGIGGAVSILLSNFVLLPVLAVGCFLLPLWYVKLSASQFKKEVNGELETALGIITTAYLRSEDILTAVEENLPHLNPPIQSVFQNFVSQVRYINPDVSAALVTMGGQIQNPVFREWCDGILACQSDRSLKTTLTPIVAKLSDMRMVNGELENLIFEPRKEFIMMVALVIGNIPLLYFLNQDWYAVLMDTLPGQCVLALCTLAIFIATACVLRLTTPIEYRR